MDSHDFSDPIVIPITITIPDPRPRPHGGRWDLGPSHHPSFTDPGWFRRQGVTGRPRAEPAQFLWDIPRYRPVPLPKPEETPTLEEFKEWLARARRRAQEIEREAGRGDYGDATQHLLLGKPYPAEVDEIPGPIFRNEEAEQTPKEEPTPSSGLDAIEAETEKIFEARLKDALDEKHVQAAENDRLGRPVLRPDGTPYDHENEVAQSKQGLERQLRKLKYKLEHDQEHGDPPPHLDSLSRVLRTIERIEAFSRS